jgi:GTPase SAR1 family protein
LALVGNKDDMYQFQEITNDEGLAFAKELNSLYKRTSAKSGKGIDDLFKEIGKKLLHPDLEITSNMTKEELKKHGEKLKREKIKNEEKKSGCCS